MWSDLKEKVDGKSHFEVSNDLNSRASSATDDNLDNDEADVEGDEEQRDQPEVDVLHRPPQLPMQVLLVAAPEKRENLTLCLAVLELLT